MIRPLNGQTWLICGGRNFDDRAMFDAVMSDLLNLYGCPSRIIHGAARGADSLAAAWADRMAIDCQPFPADWRAHGKKAGPIRNQQMLDEGKPHAVVAFPGGRGTADMVRRANAAKVYPVVEVTATQTREE